MLVLCHLDQVECRVVAGRFLADVMGTSFRHAPAQFPALQDHEWGDNMQPIAVGRLAEADQPELLNAVA